MLYFFSISLFLFIFHVFQLPIHSLTAFCYISHACNVYSVTPTPIPRPLRLSFPSPSFNHSNIHSLPFTLILTSILFIPEDVRGDDDGDGEDAVEDDKGEGEHVDGADHWPLLNLRYIWVGGAGSAAVGAEAVHRLVLRNRLGEGLSQKLSVQK